MQTLVTPHQSKEFWHDDEFLNAAGLQQVPQHPIMGATIQEDETTIMWQVIDWDLFFFKMLVQRGAISSFIAARSDDRDGLHCRHVAKHQTWMQKGCQSEHEWTFHTHLHLMELD